MNTSPTPTNGNGRARRRFRRTHRWLGVSAAVFVLFLALTGIALNHTADLGLDRRYVTWSWLLDSYGLQMPAPSASFADGAHRATLIGERLFVDGREVGQGVRALSGLVVLDPVLLVGEERIVHVLMTTGETVEIIDLAAELPGAIDRIGRVDGRAVIESGGTPFISDESIATFEPSAEFASAVTWSEGSPPGTAELDELTAAWRGRGLPLERVLLDLHSGRILSSFGPWLMDAVAIILILLSASGLVFARTRRNNGK